MSRLLSRRKYAPTFLMSTLLTLTIVGPVGATESPRPCSDFLPYAPAAVVVPQSATEGRFSYRFKAEAENYPATSPDFNILLVLPDYAESNADGYGEDGGAVLFDVPIDALPREELISYEIYVLNSQNGSPLCDTSALDLQFVVSSLSPSDVAGLEEEQQGPFRHAAATAFGLAVYTGPRVPQTEADARALCNEEFDAPTPCDWSPAQSSAVVGASEVDQPPGPTAEERPLGSVDDVNSLISGVGSSPACKTIRYAGSPDRWNFQAQPDDEIFWASEARARPSPHHADRINLYATINGGGFGESRAWASGRAGINFWLSNPESPNTIWHVRPTIRFSYRYILQAEAVSVTLAGANARAQFRAQAYDYKNNQTNPGNPPVYTEHLSNPIFPIPRQLDISGAVTDTLPPLDLQDGDDYGAFVDALTYVDVSAFGLGSAAARSNAYEGSACAEFDSCAYVRAVYVDLTMQKYPQQWWSSYPGATCEEN